jgi:SP family general alpha glucoside:H+ symporter-like MFS transporter
MEKFNETAIEVESSYHLEEASSLDGEMAGVELTIRAKDGANLERSLSPWEAIKAYPMAIFWALLVSMCVIMEGYDTILIGNFYAYPTFTAKYGMYF